MGACPPLGAAPDVECFRTKISRPFMLTQLAVSVVMHGSVTIRIEFCIHGAMILSPMNLSEYV